MKGQSKMQHYSIVGDVIKFEALDDTPWRTSSTSGLVRPVDKMVKDIATWQEKWNFIKDGVDQELLTRVKRDFLLRFIFHVNTEEEYGIRDSVEEVKECLDSRKPPVSVPQQETHNIEKAYLWLDEQVEKEDGEESLRGVLASSLIQELHKKILGKAPERRGGTPPGRFSENPRYTEWEGETYDYQNPPDMEEAVRTLLDRYNSLLSTVKDKESIGKENRVYNMFKVCSYLIFELLDLHPFGDGNGRLCRLLCSYILSVMTPFPTPIYNIYSSSSKDNYKQSLVDTRTKYERKPQTLTTMIIESNWFGWQKFLKEVGIHDA